MKKINNFFIITSVLLTSIIIGFVSCGKDDKTEPKPDLSFYNLRGTWYYAEMIDEMPVNLDIFIEFNDLDNTYSYVGKDETFKGTIKIKEKENNIPYSFSYVYNEVETTHTFNATLYKMLVATGGRGFDQIWVYHFESNWSRYIAVNLYYGNELVQILECFERRE